MTVEATYAYGIPFEKLPSYRKAEPVGTAPLVPRDSIDYALLDEIMGFIKVHPETWRQESWYRIVDLTTGREVYGKVEEEVSEVNSCGAAFCFAGHVAIAKGFPSPPKKAGDEWFRMVDNPLWETPDEETVDEFARDVLGLDEDQADTLFDAANTIDDLEFYVALLHLFPKISGDAMTNSRYDSDWLFDHLTEYQQLYT